MAESILGLLFEISADPKKAQAALAELKASTVAESTEISSLWSGAMEAITGPTGIALGAIVGLGGGLLESANKAAEFGESLLLASRRTGIAVESLSGLRVAAQMTEVPFETLEKGLEIAARNLSSFAGPGAEAGEALHGLGIKATDAHGHMKPLDQLLAAVADKFEKMPDGPEKTAAAMAIFGRSGAALIPILDEGSEGLKKFQEEAKSTGEYMTTKGAEAAEHYRQEMKLLGDEFHGLWLSMGKVSMGLTDTLVSALNAAIGSGKGMGYLESFAQGWKNVGAAVLYALAPFDDTVAALAHMENPLRKWAHELAGNKTQVQNLTDQLVAADAELDKHAKAMTDVTLKTEKHKKALKEHKTASEEAAEASRKFWEAYDAGAKEAAITLPNVVSFTQALAKAIDDADKAAAQKDLQNFVAMAQGGAGVLGGSHNAAVGAAGLDPFGNMARSLNRLIPIFAITKNEATGLFRELIKDIPAATLQVDKFYTESSRWVGQVGLMNESLKLLSNTGTQVFTTMADAMGKAAANALVYGKNFGAAMEQALKSTLASVAGQAIVHAIYETAAGFADLATPGMHQFAALHFEAAAIYGTIGGIAGVAGAAIPGGGAGGSGGGGSSAGKGGKGVPFQGSSTITPRGAGGAGAGGGTQVNLYIEGVISADTMDIIAPSIADAVAGAVQQGQSTAFSGMMNGWRPNVTRGG